MNERRIIIHCSKTHQQVGRMSRYQPGKTTTDYNKSYHFLSYYPFRSLDAWPE